MDGGISIDGWSLWMNGWMANVFVWVDEWMKYLYWSIVYIVVEYLDGWMDEWMEYLY